MIEFSFPENIHDRGYCVFSDELENHECVVFHGTSLKNFEGIQKNGFRPAQELFSVKENHPISTSFSFKSSLALGYACNEKSPENRCVVIAIKFLPSHKVVRGEGGCWDLYDHVNSQPEILGYCVIPDHYRHI